jgi:hypothetical protein
MTTASRVLMHAKTKSNALDGKMEVDLSSTLLIVVQAPCIWVVLQLRVQLKHNQESDGSLSMLDTIRR